MVQLSHPYMTSRKTIAMTIWAFVGKVMFLLFNMLSRLVIAFLPRSKHLLISWLQSPSAVIKVWHCFHFSPSICQEVMGLDAMIFAFWMLSFKPAFSLSCFTFIKRFSVPLHFLPLGWCYLHIRSYWYFSLQSWLQLVIHPAWHFTWCTLHVS